MNLILASSSPYRRQLLARTGLAFESIAPDCDETPSAQESPTQLATRLAKAKAYAVHHRFPNSAIIGSDQVAEVGGRILGKPGSSARAIEQLSAMAGNVVQFHTAVALAVPEHACQEAMVTTRVEFRALSRETISCYVAREPALDCAGGFKAEGLGIALCAAIDSQDPTALLGLPMITLCNMLENVGIHVLATSPNTCSAG